MNELLIPYEKYKKMRIKREQTITKIRDKIKQLKEENKKLRDILENEFGACMDCVDAKLEGFTICGDCSVSQ